MSALNLFEVALGVALILAAGAALRIGMPGSDGKVRSWLKGAARESLYAVGILTLLAMGISQIVTGVVPG